MDSSRCFSHSPLLFFKNWDPPPEARIDTSSPVFPRIRRGILYLAPVFGDAKVYEESNPEADTTAAAFAESAKNFLLDT